MQQFFVAPTTSSPEIDFDPCSNRLVIRGESYPENCSGFYSPMFDWLTTYLSSPRAEQEKVRMTVEILYFNSSSSKAFMDMFDMLDEAAARGVSIEVDWLYHEENETALECGEEFQEDVSHMAFNLVCIEDA